MKLHRNARTCPKSRKLLAGATGTGKTKTLQGIAEQLSEAGVPVFAADVKGDLSPVVHTKLPGPRSKKL